MKTSNLGYPRIGNHRELKKACEKYWKGQLNQDELTLIAHQIKTKNWQLQQRAGIDIIPSNDFSFYDQVLDMILMVKAIPDRYLNLIDRPLDLYFAMARGVQVEDRDVVAMEMTKWFDTNYHYIVPEFYSKFQDKSPFELFSTKVIDEFIESKELGIQTRPVIIGPVSFLLLGKEKEEGLCKLDLISQLMPVYISILKKLKAAGAESVQIDEPFLAMDLDAKSTDTYRKAYEMIGEKNPGLEIILTTYFEGLRENLSLACDFPVQGIHIDLVRCPNQMESVAHQIPSHWKLSLGLVNGRNIWKNDYDQSLNQIKKAVDIVGTDRLIISPSCSLIHCPCDLDLEGDQLNDQIRNGMAFAKQKLIEISDLRDLSDQTDNRLLSNREYRLALKNSEIVNNELVKRSVFAISRSDLARKTAFLDRQRVQRELLSLPIFPTTTIGSFPQTTEIRKLRKLHKKGEVSDIEYESQIKEEIRRVIDIQEEIGLDVLVHGEFERNDMVEYFGEHLEGFAFTQNGWVQSYGSRCVKPPIIYGDVSRPQTMTVFWSSFAQKNTNKPVKGMLTGPVTILQWSFVREDQPRKTTCQQIALALREEVLDLEKEGIRIIQVDEPAFREGLPIRQSDWNEYLSWAVDCFRICTSAVTDETQIHTHMCYSEFNDIIDSIAAMDADVITIETSRSNMELLDAFVEFYYPNEIGPGVYDIHSPRVPREEEMVFLLQKATEVLPPENIWVNPDCGLKTRGWTETIDALKNMVCSARKMRETINIEQLA